MQSEALRVMSINCGNASRKMHRLLALLLQSDPDVVCLQEVGFMEPSALGGLFHLALALR